MSHHICCRRPRSATHSCSISSAQHTMCLSVALWGLWSHMLGMISLPRCLETRPRAPPWAIMACWMRRASILWALLTLFTTVSSESRARRPANANQRLKAKDPHTLWPVSSLRDLAWWRCLVNCSTKVSSCRLGLKHNPARCPRLRTRGSCAIHKIFQ